MTAALDRRRAYAGPAFLSYGFRPFFFAAAAWAALGILLWLPVYYGEVSLRTGFAPLDWHVHEMIYGYVAASVAGFLLTAIPNWTGRLPVSGWPLGALALLWLAGRVAILVSGGIGLVAAAVIDVSFLLTLAAVAAREIVAGKNWRNLRVLVVLGLLVAGNVVFHAEVIVKGAADYGIRLSIGAAILLIALIGGRIVPSFTNNWLTRNNPGRLPVPFARFDAVALAGAALALLAWVVAPAHAVTGGLMIVATLNRTVKSFALAKVGTEYVLRWVPAGTHDWNKFLNPDELRGFLKDEPYAVEGPFGVSFNPLTGKWDRSADASVNYMMTVARD